MKIGQLVYNLDVSGGYQKLVVRSSQTLEKFGHDVTIYTLSVNKKRCYPDDIKALNIVSLGKDELALSETLRYKALASKISNELDALIVHDDLSIMTLAFLPKSKMVVAWMLNNQLPEMLGRYAAEVKHTWKHASGGRSQRLHSVHAVFNRVRLQRKGLRRVDIFATYDKFNQALVHKQLHRKADFVAAGADLDQFAQYAKHRVFSKKKQYELLSVGVIFPHRRYEDVIEAVAELIKQKMPVHATIVGLQDLSPAYFRKLESLVEQHNVQRFITFRHYVTDREMALLYKNSDAFIFVNDGFTWGIAVFEAVAACLPVVITDNIGAADLIENGQTGWVVRPRAPKEIAHAVKEIITKRNKAEKITARANKELASFISWEAYTQRMLHLINECHR